jgi:hypothetical protein
MLDFLVSNYAYGKPQYRNTIIIFGIVWNKISVPGS